MDRTRIRPGRENWPSLPFIRADLCTGGQGAHKNRPNLGSNTVSGRRQPPVSRNAAMCAGAEAEILPPIWAFFVPREQFPVYSLNEGDNKQHVGLQATPTLPAGLGWAPRNHFPGNFI